MLKISGWAIGTVSLYLGNLLSIGRNIAGAYTLRRKEKNNVSDNIYLLARLLIIIGIIAVAMGGLLLLAGKIPWLGRLPGDIVIQRKNVTFYFPIVTSVILSIVITVILWLLERR